MIKKFSHKIVSYYQVKISSIIPLECKIRQTFMIRTDNISFTLFHGSFHHDHNLRFTKSKKVMFFI